MTDPKFVCHFCEGTTGEFEEEFSYWRHKNLLECISYLKSKLEKVSKKKRDFTIYWTGTVSGKSTEIAHSIDAAIEQAKDSDEPIDIEEYPTDWTVDEELTRSENRETKENNANQEE